jgi:hypothetical protein
MRYESRRQRPLSHASFLRRLAGHAALAAAFMGVSLGAGMWGYHHFEGLGWRLSFLNAAMILGGMGPVTTLQKSKAEWFAGAFALYAGLVFLLVTGLMLAPVVHRIMHLMQWDEAS